MGRMSRSTPFAILVVVDLIFGGTAYCEANQREMASSKAPADPKTQPSGSAISVSPCSIVTKSGGSANINCNFYAPEADIKVVGTLPNINNSDGTTTQRLGIKVRPQMKLVAIACGPEVLRVSLLIFTGMMNTGNHEVPAPDGCKAAVDDGVYGDWVVSVTTKDQKSPIQLSFRSGS